METNRERERFDSVSFFFFTFFSPPSFEEKTRTIDQERPYSGSEFSSSSASIARSVYRETHDTPNKKGRRPSNPALQTRLGRASICMITKLKMMEDER